MNRFMNAFTKLALVIYIGIGLTAVVNAQTSIYYTDFGTTANVNPTGWTFTGVDMTISTNGTSSAYTGASGGAYLGEGNSAAFINTSGTSLSASQVGTSTATLLVNTTGYSNIALSFGMRKSSASYNTNATYTLEWSTDNVTYTSVAYTEATAGVWGLASGSGLSLPAAAADQASLYLRWTFVRTGTGSNFKMDDFGITGTAISACTPVSIASQPVSPAAVCDASGTAIFTVQVNGTGPFTYQWQENSLDLSDKGIYSGTNTASLMITNPTAALNGNAYRCIITNCSAANQVMTDNTAKLTVNTFPAQPTAFVLSAATVSQGQMGVNYSVANDDNVFYVWNYKGADVSINGSGNAVTVDYFATATSGDLSVVATNVCGTSAATTLSVTVKPAAVSFTTGRIVVVQTTGAASKGGSPVTLQEYKTDGTPGITVSIPASGSTPLQMAAGSGGSEGFLTRSSDGTYLNLAGYSTSATGISDITVTSASTTPRVIFKVGADGSYTQVGLSTTSYSGNDIRGAVSDGTNFWASGAANTGVDGINYYGPGTPAALGLSAKPYGLQIFNGQIYFSTQKTVTGVTPNFGIYALGNGLPTSGPITPTLVINTGTATPEDFSFNPTGDVCYIAVNLNSAVGGIQKWTNSGGVWSLTYTLGTGVSNIGAYGLVVDYLGTHPILYATTNEANTAGNRVIKIEDTGASSVATTLVQAPANTFLHGIAFAPVQNCVLPDQPAAFTISNTSPYKGQSGVTYTIPNDAAVTYSWSYSGTGATINGSGNSVTINYTLTATDGTLRVVATNTCGTSVARTLPVTLTTMPGTIRITEYMYNGGGSGGSGEFVELTNVGGTNVDMAGWSFDDNSRTPGSQDLSAFGIVKPGESVIFTELDAATFRSNWNLCAGIKIIGGNVNNLGREDEINIYDGSGNLIDRLTYGDQTYAAGSIRTTVKSGWVSAAGLGNNSIAQWTLSAAADGEASFTSSLAEIGSPGKSIRATVTFDPCFVPNTAPTIVMDVLSTSNYLDGGVATAPVGSYGVSGVLNDPTDPMSKLGIYFTIGDSETSAADLVVTVSSSNTTVVPNGNIALAGSTASRNIKITPAAVGFSTITINVSDGSNDRVFVINYAASAASATPLNTMWHTGMSDGSDAIAIDDKYYISGDDELNVLNVYSRDSSGLPFASYDYTSHLSLPDPAKPEVDLEAATRSAGNANKIYWLGSMSNGKAPFDDKPNRNRIFATTISGTGAATTFTFSGYYGDLRAQIIAWGDAHGYGFSASAAAGVDSKSTSGFAAEGMVFGPDKTTLYIGMRAPLVPTATRTKAVIVPIANFETWFNNGSPVGSPVMGDPIELDMGGRGFRDMIKLSNNTYIIVAGNPAGSPLTSAIYKWTGYAADAPVLVSTSADGLLNMEGVMQVNDNGKLSVSKLQVISDGGDDILYNNGTEAKDYADLNMRKFRSDKLNILDLCLATKGDTAAVLCNTFDWYKTTYTNSGKYTHLLTSTAGCDSLVTLNLTINKSTTSATTKTTCNSYEWNGAVYVSSGTYTFKTTNKAGCDSVATLDLTINSLPAVPTITQSGNTLISSATSGNQWYYDGTPISGATLQNYIPTQSGDYYVVVSTGDICSSVSTTKNVSVTGLGVQNSDAFKMNAFPNPFSNQLTLNYALENSSDVRIELMDLSGRPILLLNETALTSGEHQFVLDGVNNKLQNGTYLIKITTESASQVMRVTFME